MKQFKIYQLPVEHAAKFMGLDFVKENGIMPKLEDYKFVGEGVINDNPVSDTWGAVEWLDTIFHKFNVAHPEGFKGHSLSTSDMVEIDGKYYYCDSYGWVEVFTQPKNVEEIIDEDVTQEEIDLEENSTRCAGESPEMKMRIAEARRMKEYNELKNKYENIILLYRYGDFYETRYNDAITTSKVLGITLTCRKGFEKEKGHEMASFPHHALDVYLPKLIRAGHRCAIIEDV